MFNLIEQGKNLLLAGFPMEQGNTRQPFPASAYEGTASMISILGLAFSTHAFGVSVALLTLAAFAYIAIRGVFVFRK